MKDRQLFLEANNEWNIEKLHQAIASLSKRTNRPQKLTDLEATILRGLLCDRTPQEILSQFPQELQNTVANLISSLLQDLQTITKVQDDNLKKIIDSLAKAGYKQSYLDQKLQPTIEESINGGQGNLAITVKASSYLEDSKPNRAKSALITQPRLLANNSQLAPVKSEALTAVQVNDFMPSIGLWTRLGGMLLASSVVIATGLSAVIPYKTTVQAQAKIRPAGERRVVEAKTAGTVMDILVKPNQLVNQGDVIAIIDRSRLETKKSQLVSNLQQADLQLKQIKVQIQSQNHRLQAEEDRLVGAVISAKAELSRRQREYRDRQIVTNAEVKEAEANLKLAQSEFRQAETELISTEAEVNSAQASLEAAKSKLARYQNIAASGALSQNQLEEAKLDVEQQQQQVVAKQANIVRQKQEITRRQQAIAAVEAKLQSVRAGVDPIDAEIAIAQENIIQEQARGKATLASIKQEADALVQQQIEIEQQQQRDRLELKQIDQDLSQTVIRATANGTILQLDLINSGQTVTLGQEIAQIIPLNSPLIVKALVPSQEIDRVALGQKVQLKVSACPYPDFGTLKGEVTQISSDTLSNSKQENTIQSQAIASFYEVEIEPETKSLGTDNHSCLLQPGMEGNSDIIAQEETLLKYLLRKARLIVDI